MENMLVIYLIVYLINIYNIDGDFKYKDGDLQITLNQEEKKNLDEFLSLNGDEKDRKLKELLKDIQGNF